MSEAQSFLNLQHNIVDIVTQMPDENTAQFRRNTFKILNDWVAKIFQDLDGYRGLRTSRGSYENGTTRYTMTKDGKEVLIVELQPTNDKNLALFEAADGAGFEIDFTYANWHELVTQIILLHAWEVTRESGNSDSEEKG